MGRNKNFSFSFLETIYHLVRIVLVYIFFFLCGAKASCMKGFLAIFSALINLAGVDSLSIHLLMTIC